MIKNTTPGPAPVNAPRFKKGLVTIEGVTFNDAWAKTKTEKEFIAEFMAVHYQDKSPNERTELLKIAFAACNTAE